MIKNYLLYIEVNTELFYVHQILVTEDPSFYQYIGTYLFYVNILDYVEEQ